ncbi:YbaB/EbfC family nucleoid-associated protein [Micromonospora rubida]|uniref:YbaB/EbfC family nucleoid-associated protein n=1 Tax=Micromonospora rubida TaxID=2697657 RepID=UPI001376F0CE|nr:YbaB/EbfC family nucleoid-associated protein [Micromonospora rubida]NBE80096.1 YbaB/EbfC family nucleoid-associated protein [Micromonospora rubida]
MGYQDDLNEFLRQTQELATQANAASADMADREVTGACAGGAVRVTMTTSGQVQSVTIDPHAVNPDNLRHLEGRVAEAMQNALDNVRDLMEQVMRPLTDELNRLTPGQP